MQKTLYTAGYEGRVQDGLLDLLAAAGVQTLLDVRAIPMSRKPGFSKRILGASSEARGIRYCHIPSLGTPKPCREAARAGRAADMETIFNSHMDTEVAQLGLAQAIQIAQASSVCLLCFEHDPALCHRRIVADLMAEESGLRIEHL